MSNSKILPKWELVRYLIGSKKNVGTILFIEKSLSELGDIAQKELNDEEGTVKIL